MFFIDFTPSCLPYIVSLGILWVYLIAGYFNIFHKTLFGKETKEAEKVLMADSSFCNEHETLSAKTYIVDFWGHDSKEKEKENKKMHKATSYFHNNELINRLLIGNEWNLFFHQTYSIDTTILAFFNKAPPERTA